jgi:hypothetical protein
MLSTNQYHCLKAACITIAETYFAHGLLPSHHGQVANTARQFRSALKRLPAQAK